MFSIPTSVDFDKTALVAWCDQVRAIHDAIGPIEDDDPRIEQLRDGWRLGRMLDDFDSLVRADAYFENFTELPPLPLLEPAWAKVTEVDQGDWPIISVRWDSSTSGIFITQTLAFFAADHTDDSGFHKAGEVFYNEPPKIDVSAIDNLLSLDSARAVATRILVALAKAGA